MVDKTLLHQLYSSVSPRGFEMMVRDLLTSIGFDDIEVKGRSGDSGIDLTATLRKSEIPGIDTSVSYIIQAKEV
jgi:restriction endonuclease Mrr